MDVGQGLQHLTEWEKQGRLLPQTVSVRTGSGGLQCYFAYPDLDFDPKTKAGLCGNTGIDVRANGGQVVAPPSLHPSGNRYGWVDGCSPDQAAVADPPDWLVEMLRQDGKPLTNPRPPRIVVFDEMPPPQAHIDFLHPHLNQKLVTTSTGQLRRGLDASLKSRWQAHPDQFAVERRLIAAIGNLWLPPEVRPWLADDGVTLMSPDDDALDYLTLKPGHRCAQEISGGRWVSDGRYTKHQPPVTAITQMLRLMLGQVRVLIPWDQRVNRWGNRRRRDRLDTLIIPVTIRSGSREPVDLWAAVPAQRQRLIKPIASAVEAVISQCSDPPTVSYWAEGDNKFWFAVHATERLSVDELLLLRDGIIDMAIEGNPDIWFFGERRCFPDDDEASVLIYEVGLGNLDATPCPLPFSFHPAHPDRMMMAFDPATGEFYDNQVEFLLSLQRRSSLGALLSALTDSQAPSVRAAAARRRVVAALDIGNVSDLYVQLEMNATAQPESVQRDWETYVRWRDGDDEPWLTGLDAYNALFGQSLQNATDGSVETGGEPAIADSGDARVGADDAAEVFARQGWRSRLPQSIPGLYSILIGAGVLARVLAVMRDDGLLDSPVAGQECCLNWKTKWWSAMWGAPPTPNCGKKLSSSSSAHSPTSLISSMPPFVFLLHAR